MTVASGVAAVLLFALAATSYQFSWSLGGVKRDGVMPTPAWGSAVADGCVYINRTTEKLVFDVGDEGTFILSVPADIERTFHNLVGSTFSREIWITGNIYDPDARHEFHHSTVWASLWFLGGMGTVLPLAWFWKAAHQRAERMRERCAICHYWLIGNESGICPECGAPIPDTQRAVLGINT